MSEPDPEVCWEAVCFRCRQSCGHLIVVPNADDRHYVACPRCRGRGADGVVRWVRCESADDRPGPGDAG
jgi:hypothetical protein